MASCKLTQNVSRGTRARTARVKRMTKEKRTRASHSWKGVNGGAEETREMKLGPGERPQTTAFHGELSDMELGAQVLLGVGRQVMPGTG